MSVKAASALEPRGIPRALDHLVLPFETLFTAREVFHALGFTVAPDAVHPFGTGNACVFLADGIYLEPLAKVDDGAYAAAVDAGNLFVANDAIFRGRHRLPAFSAMAFRSADAIADRAELADAGIGEDGLVEFHRTFESPDGERRDVAFRLAFAKPDRASETTAFFCQPLHDRAPGRLALTRHANGACGLLRVVCGGRDVEAVTERMAALGRSRVSLSDDALGMATAVLENCIVEVASDASLAERYRVASVEDEGAIRGCVLATRSLAATRDVFYTADVPMASVDERLVVPLGASTCFIAFEEVSS